MALFKCKMCGGSLEVNDETVVTCDYCGTQQTLPKANDEIVQNLFNRANTLRLKCEFDKAEQIYEKILQENDAEPEAHWGLVLCKYGIEYVEDPKTYKRIPTCHRTSYDAVMTDAEYLAAVQYADVVQRSVYEAEARAIDRIQRDILAIVRDEKPFDVFICYKETDESGRRTVDSAIANDIYYQLTQEALKVFYAAITLEDKLGQEYEPYIFAALNSAKVMLVIGTKPQYFSAVWVKNEWGRFLALMKSDRSKLLIPCYRDMDAYELPEEFAHLQAQDMSKIGFINDVVRGIRKIVKKDEPQVSVVKETVVTGGNANTATLLKRAFMFLEDGEWDRADDFCEQVLNIDPECAQAYLGKLMAELRVKKQENLNNCAEPFDGRKNYQKAVRFADHKLASELKSAVEYIKLRNENVRKDGIYSKALQKMKNNTESGYRDAADLFKLIHGYKDADQQVEICKERALEVVYNLAVNARKSAKNVADYDRAIALFQKIVPYKDSETMIAQCRERSDICQKEEIYADGKQLMSGRFLEDWEKALARFNKIRPYKDTDALAVTCQKKIDDQLALEERRRLELARIAEEERKAEQRGKVIKTALAVLAVLGIIGVIIYVIVLNTVIIPNNKYDDAVALLKAGEIVDAYEAFVDLDGHKDSAEKAESIYEQYKIEKLKAATIGDEVYLGTYEQDKKTSNGNEKIKWIVLDIKDGKALVISKYVLDAKPFDEDTDTNSYEKVTWSDCSLRVWLNEDFYNTAFSAEEQALISTEKVLPDSNPEYPGYDTSGGKATEDKLFVLSVTEAETYFASDNARKCKATKFADSNGAHNTASEKGCYWWLRTPGHYVGELVEVFPSGSLDYYGANAGFSLVGVRPAMWIDLSLIR